MAKYTSLMIKKEISSITVPEDILEYAENPFYEFEIEKLKQELARHPPGITPLNILLKVIELNILHQIIKSDNRENYIQRLQSYKDMRMLYPEIFIPVMAKYNGRYYRLFEFDNSLLNKWLELGYINKIEVFKKSEYVTINFKQIPELL